MNGLDLFSGIGGLTLGLQDWVRPVAYCEIDPFARGVLFSRMAEGRLPRTPVWDDVRTLVGKNLAPIDIVYGGFPCQDISTAGNRAGLGGERSGLYREIMRLAGEIRPGFVFLENVAAIRPHAWRVVQDLAGLGYDCRWAALSAAEVGAPHKRNRWWLLAADSDRLNIWQQPGGERTDEWARFATAWSRWPERICGRHRQCVGITTAREQARTAGTA